MSLAGIRSNRGDAYQRAIALYWLIQTLLDDSVEGIQVDSVGLPGDDTLVLGDDVVVIFNDGRQFFIQAKVNQTDHRPWTLSDSVLKEELLSAKEQLLTSSSCEFHFYSRTPFGAFQRFIEEVRLYPDYPVFQSRSARKHKTVLVGLAELWSLDNSQTFELCQRLFIGTHHSVAEWRDYCQNLVKPHFSRAATVIELLWAFIDQQHSKLNAPQYIINRAAVLEMLKKHGIYHSLDFDEQALINSFEQFSSQGRQWVRTIGGVVIPRPALEELKSVVDGGATSVLLEDVAGGGKTCILLDLVDYLDSQDGVVTLFIKGDLFSSIESLSDLVKYGLPNDLIAQCARLADSRRLVVVIDSLDVLAVGRSHHALQSFLGLVAEFSRISNVTVVAASRSFDASYDPLLREVSWADRVDISPLSFTDDISPLMNRWGIEIGDISEQLSCLLAVPQNLRLFYALVQRGINISDIDGHDLYDSYVREVVEKDEFLGSRIVDVLQDLAVELLDRRSYYFTRNRLALDPTEYQRLLSCEVLTEVDNSQLMFSHQTLADALRIRRAQQNGLDILSFVISQPQFPFIRPSIRTFLLSLRSTSPNEFTRQVRQLLKHQDVSTHIKRLTVETLADMSPVDSDISILRQLSVNAPSLFTRFLGRANSIDWFLVLHNQWLSSIDILIIDGLAIRYLNYAAQFKNEYPNELISLWIKALEEQWLPDSNLSWIISSDLADLDDLERERVVYLLERLLVISDRDLSSVGKAISRYVEQTDKGDELLWRFICHGAALPAEIRSGRELKLRCEQHDLHTKNFLEQRLKKSDVFFRLVMEYLAHFGAKDKNPEADSQLTTIFLRETSWEQQHTQRDMYHSGSVNTLLDAVEAAMKFRSTHFDSCWMSVEESLRKSSEIGIRYLLCEAYRSNIPANIDGIIEQLTDIALLQSGYMEYELGELSSESYTSLPDSCQVIHQQLIMKLYDDYDDLEERSEWIDRVKYNYLVWVPAPYRLEVNDSFFKKCEQKFGYFRPTPHIGSWGGIVTSPVSTEKMIELSSPALIRVLRHYNSYHHWGDCFDGGMSGDRESIARALDVAASLVPTRFVSLIATIKELDLAEDYILSIVRGIATHLDARFGNTQHSGWKVVNPLPDGNQLALDLLTLIERYGELDIKGHVIAKAIESCCHVLEGENTISRICFQLWRLSTINDPTPECDNEAESLIGRGINSVRGRAAESVLILSNKLLEKGEDLTNELSQLLERYAKDQSIVVRATFLRRLPYFLSRNSEMGWRLVGLATFDQHERLWEHLEQCLYYNYFEHFNLVSPFLDRLRQQEDDKSGEVWGRLITLAYLSGRSDRETVFNGLDGPNTDARKLGVGQVFVTNLTNIKNRNSCVDGLIHLMELGAPASVYGELERKLDDQDVRASVPLSLISLYIETAPLEKLRDIDGLFAWMMRTATVDAASVLELLEKLINRVDDDQEPHHFYRPDDLVVTLQLLLQEADTFDETDFIDRVLNVQDWFIEKGVREVERLLEAN